MSDIKNATGAKGDSKPTIDAADVDQSQIETDHDNTSSIGAKNVSDNAKGGGDGSLPGDAPNTFIDARDKEGYVAPEPD